MCIRDSLKAVQTEKELPDFAEFDWLCFTSPNGVMHFFDKLRQDKRDLRTLMGMRIAVIGPGTGKKLEEYGFYPDILSLIHICVCITKEPIISMCV